MHSFTDVASLGGSNCVAFSSTYLFHSASLFEGITSARLFVSDGSSMMLKRHPAPQSKNFSNVLRAASVVEAFGYTGPCQKAYPCMPTMSLYSPTMIAPLQSGLPFEMGGSSFVGSWHRATMISVRGDVAFEPARYGHMSKPSTAGTLRAAAVTVSKQSWPPARVQRVGYQSLAWTYWSRTVLVLGVGERAELRNPPPTKPTVRMPPSKSVCLPPRSGQLLPMCPDTYLGRKERQRKKRKERKKKKKKKRKEMKRKRRNKRKERKKEKDVSSMHR